MQLTISQPQQVVTTSTENITSVISAFANSQDVKQSSRTLYSRNLTGFFNWVASTGRVIANLTIIDLITYKEELLAQGKSSLTTASYINSIRRFYEWAEAHKIYPNIGKGLHAPKRKQQFRKQPLSVQQVGQLLNHTREVKSARDYAIINLLLRTGLRTIEVVRANIEDITYKGGQMVLMVQGKGRDEKDNFVILTPSTYKPIADYLNTRKNSTGNSPLFASESHNNGGGRMTTRAISAIAKEALKEVGLNNRAFTAHSLRHTTAVNILRAGGTLEQVQYTLRHTNPATTQIYTATIREEQRLNSAGEAMLESLYNTAMVGAM